jgi:hypothetical protein
LGRIGEGGEPEVAKPEVNIAVKRYRLNQMIRIILTGIICQKSRLGIEAVIIGHFIMFLANNRLVGHACINGGEEAGWGGSR